MVRLIRWVTSAIMLAAILYQVATADEQSDAVSLSEYKIDPSAPCGTRCQIKRALGAWGDVVPVNVGGLISKYSHMKVDRKASSALKKASIGFQKRVDNAERLLTGSDTDKLKMAFKHLKLLDNRVKEKVESIPRSGSSTRAKALSAAKAIDTERKAVKKYELQAQDERSLRHVSQSSQMLANAIQELSQRQLLSPSLSARVNDLKHACKQIQQQIQDAEMQGTEHSHKQRIELESQVKALWKTLKRHSKAVEDHHQLLGLQKEMKLLTIHKAAIDTTFDQNEAGPRAVMHEVIAKTYHALTHELRKLSPAAIDTARVHKIHGLFRHMKRTMERYDLLNKRFQTSAAIVKHVAKLNSKRPPGAHIEELELKLGKIKSGNANLQLDAESKVGDSQTAPQLASDITELLSQSDDMRTKRFEIRSNLKKHLADAKSMTTSLARAQSKLNKVETASTDQEAGLKEIKKHSIKLPSIAVSKQSPNNDDVLGEPQEAENSKDSNSVESLANDIDGIMDGVDTLREDDDPWLTDFIQLAEDERETVSSSDNQESQIPFLTDEQSAEAFHSSSAADKQPVQRAEPVDVPAASVDNGDTKAFHAAPVEHKSTTHTLQVKRKRLAEQLKEANNAATVQTVQVAHSTISNKHVQHHNNQKQQERGNQDEYGEDDDEMDFDDSNMDGGFVPYQIGA
jgi:hypothetical protein